MRRFASAVFALFLLAPLLVRADGNKQLQSVKGSVSYEHSRGAARPLAHSATIVLSDTDFAITGDQSIGAVVLPESSRVTMGSDTRVQLAFFNQAQIANAKFIIYRGTTRFKIEHPNGKPANYTFQTPTAQIAVRGTEGDIAVDGKDLVLNVYGLSDPNLPVIVTTADGKKYVVRAGQQLLANWVNGQIQTNVGTLTDEAVSRFEELGAPVSNWAAAVQGLASNIPGGIASNLSGFGLPSIGGRRNDQNSAEATPAASPTPCTTPKPNKIVGFLKKAVGASDSTNCASPSPSPSPAPN